MAGAPAEERDVRTVEVAVVGAPRRRVPPWLPVALLAAFAFVAALVVQRNAFPFSSTDADEPVYRFQAQMLLDGHLTLSAAQQQEFFRPWLSGPHHGRLVLPFTWAWPAVLAGSQWLFHSMLVAVGAVAAAAVVACYLFATELLGDRRPALLAAALFALAPFTLTLGGTYLNYVFALALELFFGWMLLRGLRTRSRGWLAAAGATCGFVVFARPYDGVLIALPFAALLLVDGWWRRRDLAANVLAVAAGAVGPIALTLLANVGTTGSPFAFPTPVASGGTSRFFWGERGLVPGVRDIHFPFGTAVSSLGKNLWALPTWILGTYAALALAAYGAVRLGRSRPRALLVLLGMVVVFPIGYVAWFASALTAPASLARNGLGPHYYFPLVAPLAILTACGVKGLWERRRVWVAASAVVAIALTGVVLPAKIDDKRGWANVFRAYSREVTRGLAQRGNEDALVVLEPTSNPSVMSEHGFLANRPDLRGPVLYAIDRGASEVDLLRRYPRRRAFRIVRVLQPGVDIRTTSVVLKPLRVVSGGSVTLRERIVNDSGAPTVTARAGSGGDEIKIVLDTASVKGRSYDVVWSVDAAGVLRAVGPEGTEARSMRVPATGKLTIGVSFSVSPNVASPGGSERRYLYRIVRGSVQLLTADEEWVLFGPPNHGALPVAVGRQLVVTPM